MPGGIGDLHLDLPWSGPIELWRWIHLPEEVLEPCPDREQSLVETASDHADLKLSDGRGTADRHGPAGLSLLQFLEHPINRGHLFRAPAYRDADRNPHRLDVRQ